MPFFFTRSKQLFIASLKKCETKCPRRFSHVESKQFVPNPTWSTQDLRLSPVNDNDVINTYDGSKSDIDDILSVSNLGRLAKRSLIDIDSLSHDRRMRLESDVRGIMRCVSVLTENGNVDETQNETNIPISHELSEEEIYDMPRGLKQVTLRTEVYGDNHEQALENLLETVYHKLVTTNVKSDGEIKDQQGSYFSVRTDQKDENI